jgi:GDPmannose 4,6-dehydratase
VDILIGDSTKARTRLGWKPECDFPGLVAEMVEADLKVMAKETRPDRG